MASSIIVLGSINTDLVVKGTRLPAPGETVLGGEFYQASGGKGANQAVSAARLSTDPVTFVAAVGDDTFGRQSLASFAKENLVCKYIQSLSEHSSGVALILVDEAGENSISVASGANREQKPKDIMNLPQSCFQQAAIFLASLEIPTETVLAGLQRAKEHGLKTILNPAPAISEINNSDFLSQVDIITPNETEASQLTGIEVTNHESAVAAGRLLQTLGCKAVVITLGADGCVVIEEEAAHIKSQKVVARDTTAAGDCFNGALAVALAEGDELASACKFASHAAGISVTRLGAQPSLPTRSELNNTVE